MRGFVPHQPRSKGGEKPGRKAGGCWVPTTPLLQPLGAMLSFPVSEETEVQLGASCAA